MDPTLRAAALRGDVAALRRALNDGADPRLADEDGDTVRSKIYESRTTGVIRRHNRMVPLLVRAGATIKERHAERDSYCKAVRDAGGIRAYERLHRTTLANILNRGDRLPADVIPKIVDFWAHVGWYAIEHDRPWNN